MSDRTEPARTEPARTEPARPETDRPEPAPTDRRPLVHAIAASATVLVTSVLLGRRRAGYSHRSQYLSELGERGAPCEPVARVAFAATGLLAGRAVVLAAPRLRHERAHRAAAWALGTLGSAYVVAAVAPCDEGCPTNGTTAQAVHNLAGAAEYVGGGISLALVALGAGPSRAVRMAARAGIAVHGTSMALATVGARRDRGVYQRVSEVVLFGWLVVLAGRASSTT